MPSPLVALDIGSTKIACAIGQPNEQATGFELLGSSFASYPGWSENWLSDPLAVGRVAEEAIEKTAVSAEMHQVVVAISHPSLISEHTQSSIRLADEPIEIRVQDMDKVKVQALQQVLGVDRDPLLIEQMGYTGNGFNNARDPKGFLATRLQGKFHVITLPVAIRQAIHQAIESIGLEIEYITYAPAASFANVSMGATAQQCSLLIDVGGITTNIACFREGVLEQCRILPFGTLTLALTIAKELHVTVDQAMAWSLEGVDSRKSEVGHLIESQWQDLEVFLNEILSKQPLPDGVYLGGRGSLLDGFAEWVERTVGVSVLMCRSNRTSQIGDLSRQLGLSTAIGLLEQTAQDAPSVLVGNSPRLFHRLIDRTKAILVEYF